MGKNKTKKGAKAAQEPVPTQTEEDRNTEHVEDEGRILTPEEKAQQYKEMQESVFSNFIKDFEAEEASILASTESVSQ